MIKFSNFIAERNFDYQKVFNKIKSKSLTNQRFDSFQHFVNRSVFNGIDVQFGDQFRIAFALFAEQIESSLLETKWKQNLIILFWIIAKRNSLSSQCDFASESFKFPNNLLTTH